MDDRGPIKPLLVQTVISEETVDSLERWLAAVTDALTASTVASAITYWRIVIVALTPRLIDPAEVDRYAELCRDLGGEFSYLVLDEATDALDASSQGARSSDDSFVLVIRPTAIVLGSTISRLLAAARASRSSVSARTLLGSNPVELSSVPRWDQEACQLLEPRLHEGDGQSTAIRVDSAIVFVGGGEHGRSAVSNARPYDDSLLDAMLHRSIVDELRPPTDAFLSIVMRTQGSRPEALRDVLLCLAGQSDGRFELLLVAHDRGEEIARDVLSDQPEWLRNRTRVLSAIGGSRSHPLNVGIEQAKGTHIAFLDDDDLVLGHWVASFLNSTKSAPASVLRAQVGVQRVSAVTWSDGIEGHRNESDVEKPYPATFDLADHLRVNMTPFMAFAFPRPFFMQFGGADEELEVCEDWDLVLRAASVLGVVDISELTAVYRRWNTGNDSYTSHKSEVWERDMARVRRTLDAQPLLLPPGSATELAEFSAQRLVAAELAEVYASSSWRVTAPVRALLDRVARRRKADD